MKQRYCDYFKCAERYSNICVLHYIQEIKKFYIINKISIIKCSVKSGFGYT